MDRSLLVESTPQIDFENPWDEDVDEISRKGYADIPNATSLIYSMFLITTILMKINTVVGQTAKLMKVRLMRCLRKTGKEKIVQNSHCQNQNQNGKDFQLVML